MIKAMKSSAVHRKAEREAVKSAQFYLKNKMYREAINACIHALEQAAVADVKDACPKQADTRRKTDR